MEHDLTTCPCAECAQHRADCEVLDEYGLTWRFRPRKRKPNNKPDSNKPTPDDPKKPADVRR